MKLGDSTVYGEIQVIGDAFFNANVTNNGTFNGRDITVDGAKLDGIEVGAQVNVGDTFNSSGDYTNLRARGTLKADVGLGNADNTSDVNKPVSTAQQTALDGKVDTTDSRLSDSREWTAVTVTQADAEAGTATTRRAWTAQRVAQAVASLQTDTTYTAGTGISLSGTTFNVDNPFNPSGDYTNLRARGTTLEDVGAYSATNPDNFIDAAGAVTAIKADAAWNATSWDEAAGWGNHALAGYALSSNLATVATSGSYTDLLNQPAIPSGYMADLNRATAAQINAMNTDHGVTSERIGDALAWVSVAGTSNFTPNMRAGSAFTYNMTANRTLNLISTADAIPGKTIVIDVGSSNTTTRTLTFNSNYKGELPTVQVNNNNRMLIYILCVDTTTFVVSSMEYSL